MNNPFEPFYQRLDNIEVVLLEIKKSLQDKEQPDVHLTKAGVAEFLHCTEDTIDNYRSQGLPVLKMGRGRKVLFSKKAVIEFLEQQNKSHFKKRKIKALSNRGVG